MMVYVNGQDIARLVLGGLEAGAWSLEPENLELRPEGYLLGLKDFLTRHELEPSAITGFVIVQGPGSATALRTAHALVNALAFAWSVPVISLEKVPEAPDAEITDRLAAHAPHAFALPAYTRDPKITVTKRDALKRKLS